MKNYFLFTEICDIKIQNYIKTMNPNKSVCPDGPNIRFLKLSAKTISLYLSKLYNKCVKYGVFLEVIPIYKSG